MEPNYEASTSAYHTTERKKSNLAFAFFCLEKDRAKDMEIFYAFCRLMDDIADEENNSVESKIKALNFWKDEISAIYAGSDKLTELGKEMKDLVERRKIPQQYIQDIIDGVMRDTSDAPFNTFEDIRQYCYGVASAVGLASIYIFGFKNNLTIEFAKSLGYALQFTNILRDVVDDYRSHGRVYIPSDELEAFGVKREDLADPSKNPNCKALFKFLYFRAKHFFNKSRRLLTNQDKRSLTPALIMWAIYEKILDSLKDMDFEIPAKPFKIGKAKKIALALKAIKDSKKPEPENKNYGNAIVLGGGISGAFAALKLEQSGFDVSLYEARANLGGRAGYIDWNNAHLDNGSHALMGCYENFFGFLDILGTNKKEYFAPVSGMDFIFSNGKRIEIKYPKSDASKASKFFSFLSYKKLGGFFAFANLNLLFKLKFNLTSAKENETASDFLKRQNINQEAIKNFWEPFCVSALNTTLEDSSAKLMCDTIKKSILKGDSASLLYLPQKPIYDAIYPRLKTYIEGCGGKIYTSEAVKQIHFKDKKAIGITTSKCDFAATDHIVSTLPAAVLKPLLDSNSKLAKSIGEIRYTDILNIYFTTDKKLIEEEYACLINSPLHWIFDHTSKMETPEANRYLYGATVSASAGKKSPDEIKQMLIEEIKKFFKDANVVDVLPLQFGAATISADCKSEFARPNDADAMAEFDNLHICGDWIQTGLPCTIESAAKSVKDLIM